MITADIAHTKALVYRPGAVGQVGMALAAYSRRVRDLILVPVGHNGYQQVCKRLHCDFIMTSRMLP